MNKIIGYLLVGGMAATFFVAATQTTGLLSFLTAMWGVFLTLALIAQILRKNNAGKSDTNN